MPSRGYKLDGKSVAALRKLIKRQGPMPVAPPIAPIRERGVSSSGGGLMPVNLAVDGGDFGGSPTVATNPAGRTYSLYSLSGRLLATNCPLSTPRLLGLTEHTTATFGIALAMPAGLRSTAGGYGNSFVPGSKPAGSGSGSGSGGGGLTNYVLIVAFEEALTEEECSGSGSGS